MPRPCPLEYKSRDEPPDPLLRALRAGVDQGARSWRGSCRTGRFAQRREANAQGSLRGHGGTPSIPDEHLKAILEPTAGYNSTNAEGLQLQLASWSLLCFAATHGMWDKVHLARHSKLAPQGSIVIQRSTGVAYVVLRTSAFVALVWPAEEHRALQLRFWGPQVGPGIRTSWVPVLEASDWRAMPVSILPPHVSRTLADGCPALLRGGVFALQKGPQQSLVEASAWAGFLGVPDEILDKVIKEEGLLEVLPKGERPRGVLRNIELLIRHILPGLPEDQIGDIIMQREGLAEKEESGALMTGENLACAEGVMESKDLLEARQFQTKVVRSKKARQAASAAYCREKKWTTEEMFEDMAGNSEGKIKAGDEAKPAGGVGIEVEDSAAQRLHLSRSVDEGGPAMLVR